jgi:pyridoxamine 5'-phosphate oxidase
MSNDRIISELRQEYTGVQLLEHEVPRDPYELFQTWFDDVVSAAVPLANGMTLATVDPDGRPAARVVLLKSFDPRGFVFFTNYESRKSRALEGNPAVALLFWWQAFDRQVRIEGTIERIADAESNEYFASRPRESNLGAMASPQSRTISSRAWLEQRVADLRSSWQGRSLERPVHWGGYRVVPGYFEFWQGQPDRMHDRLCYTAASKGVWLIHRLAP